MSEWSEEEESFRQSLLEEEAEEWEGKEMFPMFKELLEAHEERYRELLQEEAITGVDGTPGFFGSEAFDTEEPHNDEEEEQLEPRASVDLARIEPSFVCDKENYTILYSGVSISGGFEPCGLLFQQVRYGCSVALQEKGDQEKKCDKVHLFCDRTLT